MSTEERGAIARIAFDLHLVADHASRAASAATDAAIAAYDGDTHALNRTLQVLAVERFGVRTT